MFHATPQDFGLHDFLLAGLLGPAMLLARACGARILARMRRRGSAPDA